MFLVSSGESSVACVAEEYSFLVYLFQMKSRNK